MAYERTDLDNQVSRITQILNEIQDQPDQVSNDTNTGIFSSSGNKGDSFGELTGVKSDTPIIANLTDLDENGASTGSTNRINLSSSLTIVDYSIPFVSIDLKYINFKPPFGTRVKFTPKATRTLVLKTGGDFETSSDISISDNEYVECVFLSETETGISGGGFRPMKLASGGGGGTVDNPMTSDLDGGGFNIFNLPTLFFDNALTKGILGNAGGVGIFAPTGDTIDFFINSLVVPKFGITETSIESNVDFNMNGQDIIGIDFLTFVGGDDILDDPTLGGLSMFLGSTKEFRIFRGVSTIAEFGNQIEFFNQLNMNVNNISEVSSLNFNNNHSIQGGTIEFAFLTASSDAETHYNGFTKISTIDSSGLTMHSSKTINMLDALSGDFMLFSQSGGLSTINYTGDLKIRESGIDILSLGGFIIQANRNIDMLNHTIDNVFSLEIEENFGSGGVPPRPTNGAKLFVREQSGDPSKRELRVYFPSGISQLIASEP